MWPKRLAFTLLLITSTQLDAHVRTDPNAFTTTTTWSGGDLQHRFSLCIASVRGSQPHDTDVINYEIQAQAPFNLSSGIGAPIPVSLAWEDQSSGQQVTLAPNTGSGEIFTGGTRYCPGGDNAALLVNVAEADIAAAGIGSYTRQFNFTVSNSGSGKKQATFTVDVTINIPNSIKISQLDDIDLGAFDGFNDIQRSEGVCVYQANGNPYALTVTGSGTGGAYEVSSGSSVIPFSLSWDDGFGPRPLTAGIPLSGLGNAHTSDPQCGGGASNNASLIVDVLASDMGAATIAGSHAGVLTIMVEMQ